ncbi:MAG: C10 family peptidase [Bacteroidales bacterium]|nr:C10 family peptidase [Bacteroidales bacterium]
MVVLLHFILSMDIGWTRPITKRNVEKVATNFMHTTFPQKTFKVKEIGQQGTQSMKAVASERAVLNYVNFEGDGWVLLSNNETFPPIIGYSDKGTFGFDTASMPEALHALLSNIKQEMARVDTLTKKNNLDWNRYKHADIKKSNSKSSSDEGGLFNDPIRGIVHWGQGANSSSTCSPRFNEYMPHYENTNALCGVYQPSKCNCERKPTGCASVAMAQIMWYWKFPPQYDWDNMPSVVNSSTPINTANKIARLLRECGDAADVVYCCNGSWCFTDDIVDGLTSNEFMFSGATKHTRGDNDNGVWWPNLVKAEIDAGRPVIYRGDECDLCGSKHFWNITGYDATTSGVTTLFYCNWGWRGNWDGYYMLSDFIRYKNDGSVSFDFRKNNHVITNIYPTCNTTRNVALSNITYSTSGGNMVKDFARSITFSNVIINHNSEAKWVATNSITLNVGFEVKLGASVSLGIYNCP